MKESGKKITSGLFLNTYATFFHFFCQWLLTVFLTRISGFEAAGQYSLALSFANVFSFIGMSGMRGLQLSDVQRNFSDGQFYALRVVSCSLALVVFAIGLALSGYSSTIVLCCIAMMAFKTVDCIYDVVIGSMQRNERFDRVALSATLRGIIPMVAFLLAILLGWPLFVAILLMAAAGLLCLGSYDFRILARAGREENRFRLKGTGPLVKACLPLVISSVLDSAMSYIPRDAVERALGSEMLGYYSTVSIVVVILSTMGTAAWASLTPPLSRLLYQREYKPLCRFIVTVLLVTLGVGVLGLIFGNLLGPFFFRIIFGEEILAHMYLLTPVLINALLMLINSFFLCLFVPMGKRMTLLWTNGVAVVCCVLTAAPLVAAYGLTGACVSLSLALLLRLGLLTVSLLRYLQKMKRENNA
ncbi:MAG: lipopolysaccharide biosynthesis protein [Ruminococcaceae bacterium]|nr:lipopolysaccharide biosynthesis protein [Oscillospiraceae bacterium]